jgi:predicted Zn-dependent protease
MKTFIQNKKLLAGVVLASFAVAAVSVHFGCKDGQGSDLRNQFANTIGDITGQRKVAQGAVAVMNYGDKITLSADDEDGMGQSVAVSLTNTYTLTKNEKLNKYVSLVGLTLVNASPRPVGNWVFGVLESNEVNAFAGPNGYIFVTTGALKQMQDEAELAGVLAHELTHVLHHHALAGIKNDANVDLLKEVGSMAVADQDRFGVVKLTEPVVDGVAKKGYGRKQELDADKTAIEIVVAAGYDPDGLVRFLQRLENSGGDLMSTHPGKAERVSAARAKIAQLGNPSGKTLKDRFAKNVNVR